MRKNYGWKESGLSNANSAALKTKERHSLWNTRRKILLEFRPQRKNHIQSFCESLWFPKFVLQRRRIKVKWWHSRVRLLEKTDSVNLRYWRQQTRCNFAPCIKKRTKNNFFKRKQTKTKIYLLAISHKCSQYLCSLYIYVTLRIYK